MIRYNYRTDNPWFGNGFVQHSEGEWVKHKDVESMGIAFADCIAENARLKAEVERLRAASFVTAVPVEEYEKLKAEVERLKEEKNELNMMIHPVALKAWMNLNAAKEGKPHA